MSTSARLAVDNSRFPWEFLLHHPELDVILLATPKVGCSTIKRWMIARFAPNAESEPGFDIHRFAHTHFGMHRFEQHARDQVLAQRPVVAFVRSPAERLRSAFIDKFVRPAPDQLFEAAIDVLAALGRSPNEGLSFKEFVRHVVSADPMTLDAHWRPQSTFLLATRPAVVRPIEQLSDFLRSLAPGADLPTEPMNITRKEPNGEASSADARSTDLHGRDLRPVLADLIDEAVIASIASFDQLANDIARGGSWCPSKSGHIADEVPRA
ncbi:MAG: sulfotransferase family protein [Phycisphaerales bacterium]|nr:sulfotransferase family protein [Phycisphaerales bacterium]